MATLIISTKVSILLNTNAQYFSCCYTSCKNQYSLIYLLGTCTYSYDKEISSVFINVADDQCEGNFIFFINVADDQCHKVDNKLRSA